MWWMHTGLLPYIVAKKYSSEADFNMPRRWHIKVCCLDTVAKLASSWHQTLAFSVTLQAHGCHRTREAARFHLIVLCRMLHIRCCHSREQVHQFNLPKHKDMTGHFSVKAICTLGFFRFLLRVQWGDCYCQYRSKIPMQLLSNFHIFHTAFSV